MFNNDSCSVFTKLGWRPGFTQDLPQLVQDGTLVFEMGYSLAEAFIFTTMTCGWLSSVNNALSGCKPCNETCIPTVPPQCGECVPFNQTLDGGATVTTPITEPPNVTVTDMPPWWSSHWKPSENYQQPESEIDRNNSELTLRLIWGLLFVYSMIQGCKGIVKTVMFINGIFRKVHKYNVFYLYVRHGFKYVFRCCFSQENGTITRLTWDDISDYPAIAEPMCRCCSSLEFVCWKRQGRAPPNVDLRPFDQLISYTFRITQALEEQVGDRITLQKSLNEVAARLHHLCLETERQLAENKDRLQSRDTSGNYSMADSMLSAASRSVAKERETIKILDLRLGQARQDIENLAGLLLQVAEQFNCKLSEQDLRHHTTRESIERAQVNFEKLKDAYETTTKNTHTELSRHLNTIKTLSRLAEQEDKGRMFGRRNFPEELYLVQNLSSSMNTATLEITPLLSSAARPAAYQPIVLEMNDFSFTPRNNTDNTYQNEGKIELKNMNSLYL